MSLFDSMKARYLFLFFVIASISACVKAPDYPIVPAIEFKSVSSDFLKSGSIDTIIVTFTDGDGDIGVNPSDDDTCDQCGFKTGDSCTLFMRGFNVFMVDSRDTCINSYASGNVGSSGRYDAISGEIVVIRPVDTKKCLIVPSDTCELDTVVYKIFIRDRAGHLSNAVLTTPIVIDGE